MLFLCLVLTGCCHRTDTPKNSFAKGCDISWLSEMEHDNVPFYYTADTDTASPAQDDCIAILRAQGMNAVRLRVWVNHATGWSNKEDMLTLAKRAAQAGQRIMIDFHYSDFFADPQHQSIPAAWREYTYEQLCEAVREHTLEVLYALKEEGICPEWVQIGNETPNGMLWPVARIQAPDTNNLSPVTGNNWSCYAGLTTVGYNAAKEAFPAVKVIVHVDNAYDYRDWFWDAMREHGGKFDMIGLSHYPMMTIWSGLTWQEANQRADANIRRLISTYHVPVMVCEIGMENWGEGLVYDSVAALSDTVMTDFLTRISDIDSCMGVFYWEPQVYGGWKPAEYAPLGWDGYNMGSFTPDGQPSPALQSLLGLQK